MEPPLAAVGSAPVAVLSQSSGIACHEGVVTWCTIIAPFTCCCTNSAVASIAVVTELSSKREVCVLGTPSSFGRVHAPDDTYRIIIILILSVEMCNDSVSFVRVFIGAMHICSR